LLLAASFFEHRKYLRHQYLNFFGFFIADLGDRTQTANTTTIETAAQVADTTKQLPSASFFNHYGFDTA